MARRCSIACDEAVERGVEIVRVGQHDVAPDGIGAAGQAQGVAQAAARERERQAGLVGGLVRDAGQRHGQQLRQVRNDRGGAVVRGGVHPDRPRADGLEQAHEIRDARVGLLDRSMSRRGASSALPRSAHISRRETGGIRGVEAGNFAAGHGMAAEKTRAAGKTCFSAAAQTARLVLAASVTSARGAAWRAISGRRSMVSPTGSAT